MDIQMPVMDGIEATTEIRRIEKTHGSAGPGTPVSDLEQRTPSDVPSLDSKNPATPYRSSVIIVALTASSLQSDRVAALAAGCNDFLTKPVSLQWLNNKIIEWGSIKALQMWADLRPEVVKSISSGQVAQAQNVARKLHVPEGRATPTPGTSRNPANAARPGAASEAKRTAAAAAAVAAEAPRTVEAPRAVEAPKQPAIIQESLPPKMVAQLKASAATPSEGDITPRASEYPGVIITEATPTPKSAPGGGAFGDEADEAPLPAVAPSSTDTLEESRALTPPAVPPEPIRAELPPTPEDALTPRADDMTPSTLVADDTIEWAKGRAPSEGDSVEGTSPAPIDTLNFGGTVPGGTTVISSDSEMTEADVDNPGRKDGPTD